LPGSSGDLWAAALELLNAAADCLLDSIGGPPVYQAIWQGLPPFDAAPALHVHASGPSFAETYPLQPPLQPTQRIVTTGVLEMCVMTVTIVRLIPVPIQEGGQTVSMPSPAEVMASTEVCYSDLWALWNGLVRKHRDGTLFQSPSKRREFVLDGAVMLKTSGGFGGWEIPVRFNLPGYAVLS
jgi:hypothetical protein